MGAGGAGTASRRRCPSGPACSRGRRGGGQRRGRDSCPRSAREGSPRARPRRRSARTRRQSRGRPVALGAAGVRHDAELAALVAALHRRHERGHGRGRRLGPGSRRGSAGAACRTRCARAGARPPCCSSSKAGSSAMLSGPTTRSTCRDSLEKRLALLLRDASGHRDDRVRVRPASAAELADLAAELLLGLLPHAAGVEHDDVRVLRRRSRPATGGPQDLGHARRSRGRSSGSRTSGRRNGKARGAREHSAGAVVRSSRACLAIGPVGVNLVAHASVAALRRPSRHFQDGSVDLMPGRELFGTKKDGRWDVDRPTPSSASAGRRLRAAGSRRSASARGDHVAIIANNRVEWAVAAYASYGLGAAFVPMYEAAAPTRTGSSSFSDCEAKVLIVATGPSTQKALAFAGSIPSLTAHRRARREHQRLEPERAHARSRATRPSWPRAVKARGEITARPERHRGLHLHERHDGNPKGVILTHLEHRLERQRGPRGLPRGADDRSLSFLPWAHVFGQTVRAARALLARARRMAICECGREDHRQPRRGAADAALQRPAHLQQDLHGGAEADRGASRQGVQLAGAARRLKTTAKERDGETLSVARARAPEAVDALVFAKVRARFGGQLKYAFSGGAALSRDVAEFIDRSASPSTRATASPRRAPSPRRTAPARARSAASAGPSPAYASRSTGPAEPPRRRQGTRFERRDRRLRAQRDEGLPQPPRRERRGAHERRRLPHRRHGVHRLRGFPLHHRPHQGAVQARERQVRRADARSRRS